MITGVDCHLTYYLCIYTLHHYVSTTSRIVDMPVTDDISLIEMSTICMSVCMYVCMVNKGPVVSGNTLSAKLPLAK